MMTVPSRVLLQDLLDKTDWVIKEAEQFKQLTYEQLCQAPAPGQWSVGECLLHLNLYGQYYIPHILEAMTDKNLWKSLDTVYKSTWLGNWFANSMLPGKGGEFKKLKSPQNKKPSVVNIPTTIVDDFIEQQLQYKKIFMDADRYSLNKAKVAISIMSFVKINLGDTLRFCIYHNIRHIEQANKVYKNVLPHAE